MSWSFDALATAIEDGWRTALADVELEQAVRGLDQRDELGLHPVVHASLVAAGFGAHREQRYPSERGQKKKTVGRRCDVVVTPDGLPLQDEAPQGDLFSTPR